MSRTAELAFIVSVKSELDLLQRDLDRTRKKLGQVSGGFSNTKKVAASLERGLLVLGGAAIAGTVVADKMAMNYQASMQKIVGLVGVSQTQVDAWSKQLLELGPKVAKSPQELADALYYVSSAGFRGADAISVLDATARAASAGLGETMDVANAVTSAVNAYGIEALSASKATDILVAAVRDGKMPVADLAPVMGQVIPMADRMGVSFDQVAAAMAIVSRTGMDMSTAAVGLNQFFTGLLKTTPKGTKALKAVGLTYEELRADLRKPGGLPAVIQLLNDKFKGNDAALVKVIPNVRALRPLLSILAQDGATTAGIFEDVANSVGSSSKAFATAAETDLFKYNQAMATLTTTAITFGEATLPMVTKGMEAATKVLADLTAGWNALTPAQQDSKIETALWAAGLAAGTYVIVKAVIEINTLVKAYKELKLAASMTSFGGTLGAAGIFVAGLTGGLYLMYGAFKDNLAVLDRADAGQRLYNEAIETGNYDLYDAWAAEMTALTGIDTRRKGVRAAVTAEEAYQNTLRITMGLLTESQSIVSIAAQDRVSVKQAQDVLDRTKKGTAEYTVARLALTAAETRASVSGKKLIEHYSKMTEKQIKAAVKSGDLTKKQGAQATAMHKAADKAKVETDRVRDLTTALGNVQPSVETNITVNVHDAAVDALITKLRTIAGSKYVNLLGLLPKPGKNGKKDGPALGGILSGSSDGYPVYLHGIEAVLPLNNPRRYFEVRAEADKRMGVGGGNTIVHMTNQYNIPATIKSDTDLRELAKRLAFETTVALRTAGVPV